MKDFNYLSALCDARMNDCVKDDSGNIVTDTAGDVASSAANKTLESLVAGAMESVGKIATEMATLWISIPMPPLTGTATSASSQPISPEVLTLASYLWWIGLAVGILAVIAVGARMVLSLRSGDGSAAFGRLGWVFAGILILSSASSVTGLFLTSRYSVGASEGISFVQVSLFQWTAVLAMTSVMIAAIRTMWHQRGQELVTLASSLLRLGIVAAGAVIIVNTLAASFDSFSIWILQSATDCDFSGQDSACFGEKLTTLALGAGAASAGSPLVQVLGMLMALLVISVMGLTLMLQMMLLIFRTAIMTILVGMLPLATSFTNTEMGMKWFKNCVGWLLAALLYKPVAALIIAAGIRMSSEWSVDPSHTIITTLLGLTVLLLSVIAMPALMRLCVPAVAQSASGMNATMMATNMVLSSGIIGGDMVAKHFKNGPEGASSGGNKESHTSSSSTNSSPTGAMPGNMPGVGSGPKSSIGSGAATSSNVAASGSGAASSAGAASGAGAAGGAAAAAGPAGAGVMVAEKVIDKTVEGAKKVAETVNSTAQAAIGSGDDS